MLALIKCSEGPIQPLSNEYEQIGTNFLLGSKCARTTAKPQGTFQILGNNTKITCRSPFDNFWSQPWGRNCLVKEKWLQSSGHQSVRYSLRLPLWLCSRGHHQPCEADQIDDCLEPFPRAAHSFSKVLPEELAHSPDSIWWGHLKDEAIVDPRASFRERGELPRRHSQHLRVCVRACVRVCVRVCERV